MGHGPVAMPWDAFRHHLHLVQVVPRVLGYPVRARTDRAEQGPPRVSDLSQPGWSPPSMGAVATSWIDGDAGLGSAATLGLALLPEGSPLLWLHLLPTSPWGVVLASTPWSPQVSTSPPPCVVPGSGGAVCHPPGGLLDHGSLLPLWPHGVKCHCSAGKQCGVTCLLSLSSVLSPSLFNHTPGPGSLADLVSPWLCPTPPPPTYVLSRVPRFAFVPLEARVAFRALWVTEQVSSTWGWC